MKRELELNPNKVVAFLGKPAREFTKADIVRYISENGIRMVNFMYPAGDGRLKTPNFVINNAAYLDAKEYAKAKVKIDEAFKNALPYFEKAYELEPDNDSFKRSLRSLYYRLGMNDKYEALED